MLEVGGSIPSPPTKPPPSNSLPGSPSGTATRAQNRPRIGSSPSTGSSGAPARAAARTGGSGRSVDVGHGAAGERHRAHEPESERAGQGREQGLAAAESDGMDEQPILVGQAELREALREAGAAVG